VCESASANHAIIYDPIFAGKFMILFQSMRNVAKGESDKKEFTTSCAPIYFFAQQFFVLFKLLVLLFASKALFDSLSTLIIVHNSRFRGVSVENCYCVGPTQKAQNSNLLVYL
jgi:hypothetical protein